MTHPAYQFSHHEADGLAVYTDGVEVMHPIPAAPSAAAVPASNSFAERRATRAVTTTEAPCRGRGALYVFDPGDYDHGSLTAAGERIYEAAFNEATAEYNEARTRLWALYNEAPGDHANKVDAVFGSVHDWLDDDIREDLADEFEKMGGKP